ncbi:hypothetical protein NC652_034044 [Populus alba x Populus x berolinensis]|nr:hypothetical protein NC652_034044 [Populus alba x Populus x berolinensis]
MTSILSRLSYARVLVELDLREDTPHSITVSLPSDSVLQQKVIMSLYQNSEIFTMLLAILGSYAPKLHLVPPRELVGPSVAPNDGWITMVPRCKFNKHASSPPKEKIMTHREDDSGKAPCLNLAIPVCANTAYHLISTGGVVASECTKVIPTVCADVVTPECVVAELTVVSSSLRTPNWKKVYWPLGLQTHHCWGIWSGPLGSIIARGPILVVEGTTLLLHLYDNIQLEFQGTQ